MTGTDGKTYYEILGVERNATKDQIREAYREIARVYHPDSNFYSEIIDDSMSSEQSQFFKLLTQAYNTLANEQSRAEYDEELSGLSTWEEDRGVPKQQERKPSGQYQTGQRPRQNSGTYRSERYVFGSVNKTTMFENAFARDVKSVSQMMNMQQKHSRGGNGWILRLTIIMPIIAFLGLALIYYYTRIKV